MDACLSYTKPQHMCHLASGSRVEIGIVLGSYKVPAGIEISKEQVLVMHLAIEGTYQ